MNKIFQKKIIDVGYKRCSKCGFFTPQKVYVSTSQKMILGFSFGQRDTQYILLCPNCKSNIEISEDRIQGIRNYTKEHLPYQNQKEIWKLFFETHKENAQLESKMNFKDFFELIKTKACEKVEIEISDKEWNYLFNAYLSNYMKQRQKEDD